MRRITGACIVFFMLHPALGAAQTDVRASHQASTVPANARYEIVQSELAAQWTFRLDRFTGNVDQLVKTKRGGTAWEKMPVSELPRISSPSKPRFVLFTSGLAARHTFLIDSVTEPTWALIEREVRLDDGQTATVDVWARFEE